jgi:hypothetical protein
MQSARRPKKNNRKNKKIKFKRSYRSRPYNTTRYMYSRALQTMGVGTAKVRVTRFYSYLPNTIGTSQNWVSELVRDSVASQEFNRFAQDFSYTRLQTLTITCVPNAANSSTPIFFKIDWIDSESADVTFDDNSKLVWQTTMKPITYKFKPPNILLNNLDPEKPIKINYREWQDSKTLVAENIPGYLKLTASVTVKLIGEVTWIFRGYNAKFPYTKEIVNKDSKENRKGDEIDEIINDLKVMAEKKDQIEDKEEKKEREIEWKEELKKKKGNKDRNKYEDKVGKEKNKEKKEDEKGEKEKEREKERKKYKERKSEQVESENLTDTD